MLKLTLASSKCAEQRDSNQELRALAEGVHTGYLQEEYTVNKKKFCVQVFLCFYSSVYLSVCLSSVRLRTYFITLFLQHTHTCKLRLVWISMENIPDCNGSHLVILTPCLPSLSTPRFPHRRHLEPIGGRVTPSHKALKGSQTHWG